MSSRGPHSARVEVPLAPDHRADAAAAAVCRALAVSIAGNVPGAIAGVDPEHLHQLRIAVRRTRSVARQLAGAFEPQALSGFRAELRWLQRATGDARDLDVYVSELESLARLLAPADRGDLELLRPALERRRLGARAQMTAALGCARTTELLADWDRLLESLVDSPAGERPDAERTIAAVAGRRARRIYEVTARLGSGLRRDGPADAYHELRKRAKELRYLLELFGPALPAEVVGALLGPLKAVQDLLGRHQDRQVQIAMLRSVADEVASLPGGGASCLAMGILCERLAADQADARASFAKRFEDLAGASQRRLVAAKLPR
ncbi:MAG: CHAD domain-containing protein [Solirubrobacteraceae bacterium]